jgi:hypothetical protein
MSDLFPGGWEYPRPVESSAVPPGYLYLAAADFGAVLYEVDRRPWWRRALAWLGRWTLEALTAAGRIWALQPPPVEPR